MVHAKGFEAREHTVSSGTRFAKRGVAQLPVEPCRKMRAKIEATMPDGRDLTQIKLAFFIRKRETLIAGCAIVSRKAHIGRIAIGIKANRVATLARDGFSH